MALSPKWDVFIKALLPQSSEGSMKRGHRKILRAREVKDSKETAFSSYKRTDTHMNSGRLLAYKRDWQHIKHPHKSTDNIPPQRKKSRYKVPPKKLFTNDT